MSAAAGEHDWRGFAVRVSLLFAAVCTVVGTQLPFYPVWLDWRGLGASEIAIITAAPLVVRVVVTPALAFAADRFGDHRRFLIGLAWAGLLMVLALAQLSSFWPLLLGTVLFSLAMSTIMPLTETLAMTGVKAAGLDYGRMRLWGSISFIVASICGGWLLEPLGAGAAIWLVAGGVVLTVVAAHGLQRPIGLGRLKAATSPPRLTVVDALGLLGSRVFLLFLLTTALVQGAHGMFYTFGVLHWQAQGLDTAWSGMLWGVAIFCEVVLFAYSAPVLRRIGPVQLIMLGCGAAVLRWLVMGFDPPLALLVLLQISHSLTYTASHIGAIHFMSRVVPDQQAGTAQALYASVTGGIGLGGAMLIAGPLYASYGGRAYWAMAIMAAAALAASLALRRLAQPHSAGLGGDTSAPS